MLITILTKGKKFNDIIALNRVSCLVPDIGLVVENSLTSRFLNCFANKEIKCLALLNE